MTNQTIRVLELLKRFNDGQKVCISSLQNDMLWEEKTEKTIRRDLDVIKEMFPDSFTLLRGEGNGCYKAITKEVFDNFLSKDTLSLMVRVFSVAKYNDLFDGLDIGRDDKDIIEKKIDEFKKIYEFKSKPFENKRADKEMYKKLENAIYHKKRLEVFYEIRGKYKKRYLKPYKILFMNENFYLACETENEKHIFTLLRISKIKSFEVIKDTFYHKKDIDKFIKSMQTPLATYSENFEDKLIDIEVKVDSTKAEHFLNKKHLASQKIEDIAENGDLILSFKVTQNMEMEELVKKWIPYIRVIKPLGLKKKIEKELLRYLES